MVLGCNLFGLIKKSGVWLFFPAILFLMVIPKLYVWTAEVPEIDSLYKIEGSLIHKKISNRKGWVVGVQSGSKSYYFTCGYGVGARHTCYVNRLKLPDYKSIDGASSEIWWYEQPVYLFYDQKRLARLDVSGRTIISIEDTKEDVQRHARSAPWWLVAYILFCLVSGAWLVLLEGRKDHG